MGSGDLSILAWTGHAGSYNSCLPVDLTVYNEVAPPHIPKPIEKIKMDRMATELRSSLPDISTALKLYERLSELPPASIAGSRLRLPCIIFPVTEFTRTSESKPAEGFHVYRFIAAALGNIEIKTSNDLSGMEGFLIVYPWISTLLEQDMPHHASGIDDTTRALQLIARLRQPFGALLLASLWRGQYRRVAADCLIMVQFREETPLGELMNGIRTVDIQ